MQYDYERAARLGWKWTKPMDDMLRELWGAKSISLLADDISKSHTAVTRNAIVSRAHRIKLPGLTPFDDKRARRKMGQQPKARGAIKYLKRIRPPAPPSIVPLNIPFLDIGPNQCREVVGQDGLALFCGHPRAEASSYCPFHHHKNHRPYDGKSQSSTRCAKAGRHNQGILDRTWR